MTIGTTPVELKGLDSEPCLYCSVSVASESYDKAWVLKDQS